MIGNVKVYDISINVRRCFEGDGTFGGWQYERERERKALVPRSWDKPKHKSQGEWYIIRLQMSFCHSPYLQFQDCNKRGKHTAH